MGRKKKEPVQDTRHLDGLTIKQRKLIDILVNEQAGSDKEALVAAGYSENSNSTDIIRGTKIREALQAELERRGITTKLIGEVLHDGLTAREDHLDPSSKPERMVRLKYYEKIANILGVENQPDNSNSFNWESLVQNVQINYNRNTSDEC